jgi:hypothetical protein
MEIGNLDELIAALEHEAQKSWPAHPAGLLQLASETLSLAREGTGWVFDTLKGQEGRPTVTLTGNIGEKEVREAVVKWLKEKYGLDIKPEQLREYSPDYETFGGYEWDHMKSQEEKGN